MERDAPLLSPFVPAQAGTQGPEAVALDPRLRGDERSEEDRKPIMRCAARVDDPP